MAKIALGIEYVGTNFHGWQMQKNNIRTVQLVVENALSKIANHKVKVYCAGRTDAGVHALEQVVHFQTNSIRNNNAWLIGANSYLTSDVSIKWVRAVDDDFHARFSAMAREYTYYIYNHPTRCALHHIHNLWFARKLELSSMQQAAQYLLGTHNFTSFQASLCQAKSSVKTIEYLNITKNDNIIAINIKANAFLHHMVRNIVGTLIKIGLGDKDITWMQEVLESRNRINAGATIEACGLHFIKAYYPDKFF